MIDKGPDLNFLRQLRHSAYMVIVVMGDHNVVDLIDSRELRGRCNAVGVSAFKARPSRIDQHGLAGGADDKRCLSTFHINEIDVEWLLSLCQREQRDEQEDCKRKGKKAGDAHSKTSFENCRARKSGKHISRRCNRPRDEW